MKNVIKTTTPVSKLNADRLFELLEIKLEGYVYHDNPVAIPIDFPCQVSDNNEPMGSNILIDQSQN